MKLVLAAVLMLGVFSTRAVAELVDLSTWSVVQYEQNDQADADWNLINNNHSAVQTINADASILLSDFDVVGKPIDGQWSVLSGSDNDFMGFVFGFQGRGQFYLFDWKQSDQDAGAFGLARMGMSVKVVNIPGGADPPPTSLWPTAGGQGVTTIFHNFIPWSSFTTYDFHLFFTPGQFTIAVNQSGTQLLLETISDSTFTSGKFGFYNYSQDHVQYDSFTIPEPASWLTMGIGMSACFGALGIRRHWVAMGRTPKR